MRYEFKNPILEGADPFLLKHGDKYYMYFTGFHTNAESMFDTTDGNEDGFLVYESENLKDWSCRGQCLSRKDVMGDKWFWAPEVLFRNGRFYMVYTSEEHCGIATADSPLGPFVQTEKRWLSERKMIDGHFFTDDDGQTYLYYVRIDGGNRIYVAKLSDDLMTLDEKNERLLIEAREPWETRDCLVAEGPFVLKHKGIYYLSYSANHTRCQDYAVGYATSDSPLGPFKKYKGNPILSSGGDAVGVGHHSFAPSPREGMLLCAYHRHASKTQFIPRMACIDTAEFVPAPDGGCDVLTVHGPTNGGEI